MAKPVRIISCAIMENPALGELQVKLGFETVNGEVKSEESLMLDRDVVEAEAKKSFNALLAKKNFRVVGVVEGAINPLIKVKLL